MSLDVSALLAGQTLDPFIDARFPIDYDDPEWKRLFAGERDWMKSAKKEFTEFERESRARIERSSRTERSIRDAR